MKKFAWCAASSAACALVLAAGFAWGAGPDLEKADALMKAGKPAEAYSLLEPFEFEQAGNVKYDYLLGISALDSGKPDKATLAFERVLAVDPNFAGARLDMARAYFQLGDYARAKLEFETVLSQNPPEAARVTVQKYLAAIDEREKAKRTLVTGYVEGSVGHDTNVNASTSQGQIPVPALGNLVFTLNPSNVKAGDNYLSLGAGGEVNHQIADSKFSVYAGADLKDRANNTQDKFDFMSVDARAGLGLNEGANTFRAGLIGGRFWLDNKQNRDTGGVNADWRRVMDPSNQLNVFGQFARYRFEPTVAVNNFDQSTVGAGWLHVLGEGKALVFGTLFTGTESAIERADGGKRFNGLRIGGQTQINEKTDLFASLGAQRGNYAKQNVSFLTTRSDSLYDFAVGLNWRFAESWTLRPQLLYARNNSNIVIYQYDRTDVSVTVRRDFR